MATHANRWALLCDDECHTLGRCIFFAKKGGGAEEVLPLHRVMCALWDVSSLQIRVQCAGRCSAEKSVFFAGLLRHETVALDDAPSACQATMAAKKAAKKEPKKVLVLVSGSGQPRDRKVRFHFRSDV